MNILINESVYNTLHGQLIFERSNILFEKSINIGSNLEHFLDKIGSPLALDLLDFLQSDNIKDTSNIGELDLDSDNPTVMKAKIKTQRGDKLQNVKFVKGLRALGGDFLLQKYHEREFLSLLSKLRALSSGEIKTGDLTLEYWKGVEIYNAYDCRNYTQNLHKNSGLNKSCMKHEESQPYLQLYVDNSSVVSCLVLLDNEGLIHGRALVWKLDNAGKYMDRIYVAYGHYAEYFMQFANQNGMKYYQGSSQHEDMEVTLSKGKYTYYPYMDTFTYAYVNSSGKLVLTTDKSKAELELEQIDGSYRAYVELYNGVRQRKNKSTQLFDGNWADGDDPDLVDMHDGTLGIVDFHDIVELDGMDEWAERKDAIQNSDGGWELKPKED